MYSKVVQMSIKQKSRSDRWMDLQNCAYTRGSIEMHLESMISLGHERGQPRLMRDTPTTSSHRSSFAQCTIETFFHIGVSLSHLPFAWMELRENMGKEFGSRNPLTKSNSVHHSSRMLYCSDTHGFWPKKLLLVLVHPVAKLQKSLAFILLL